MSEPATPTVSCGSALFMPRNLKGKAPLLTASNRWIIIVDHYIDVVGNPLLTVTIHMIRYDVFMPQNPGRKVASGRDYLLVGGLFEVIYSE